MRGNHTKKQWAFQSENLYPWSLYILILTPSCVMLKYIQINATVIPPLCLYPQFHSCHQPTISAYRRLGPEIQVVGFNHCSNVKGCLKFYFNLYQRLPTLIISINQSESAAVLLKSANFEHKPRKFSNENFVVC